MPEWEGHRLNLFDAYFFEQQDVFSSWGSGRRRLVTITDVPVIFRAPAFPKIMDRLILRNRFAWNCGCDSAADHTCADICMGTLSILASGSPVPTVSRIRLYRRTRLLSRLLKLTTVNEYARNVMAQAATP